MKIQPVLACRPVDWAKVADLVPDEPPTPVYPGSVVRTCGSCPVEIYVGPKAQEVMAARADAHAMCFRCALIYAAQNAGGVIPLGNLGNDYVRREP